MAIDPLHNNQDSHPGVEDMFSPLEEQQQQPVAPEPVQAPQPAAPASLYDPLPQGLGEQPQIDASGLMPVDDQPSAAPELEPLPEGLPPHMDPVQPVLQQEEVLHSPTVKTGRGSKIRMWITIAAVGVIVVAGVILLLRGRTTTNTNTAPVTNINQVVPVETPTANTNTEASAPEVKEARLDSDGDGLLDSEEKQYGTKIDDLDTDDDGLTDRQEVMIYGTDPKKKDTDKDGYDDGDEVRNFYNPNGEGKLLDTVEAIQEQSEETDTE